MKFFTLLFTAFTTFALIGCGVVTPNLPTASGPTSTPKPLTGSWDEITADAKSFVTKLVNGNYSDATTNFDNSMRGAADANKLKDLWTQLESQVGAFQSQTGTHTDEKSGFRMVYVTCKFANADIDVRVVYNSLGQISGLQFVPAQTGPTPTPVVFQAPAYVQTSNFADKEVTVGSGDWALPGTLSIPTGAGPFPAVVLVQGSGPNDRNETIGPNQPFKDIAWGLASQGIAVLRYDKRTKVYGQKMASTMANTITPRDEVIDDALLAVQLLRKNPLIDPQHIYIVGHSLGAMLAPWIAREDPQITGVVLLAAPSRPLEDIYVDQMNYLFSLNGGPTDVQKQDLQKIQTQVAKVKDPNLAADTPLSDLPMNTPASYWLALRGYDPVAVAKALNRPVLVLWGERDYQVMPVDYQGWQTGLAGDSLAMLKSFPDLNHLFITGQGKSVPSEYDQPGHVAEGVITAITGWIKH